MEFEFKEYTAKTTEEAIEEGLKDLCLQKEEAMIVVLEEGKKKLFGWQKARVKIARKFAVETEGHPSSTKEIAPVKEEVKKPKKEGKKADQKDGERAGKFVEELFAKMGTSVQAETSTEGDKIVVTVTGAEGSAVIGKRGVVIDAVQTLAGAVANTGRDDYARVTVDCENYRARRAETLKKLAENLANKAVRLERKIKLEPMNPYERRIMHAALSERKDVTTKSEGSEPNRYLVIIPENASDRPPLPAREERDSYRKGREYGDRGRIDRKGRPHTQRGRDGRGNRPRPLQAKPSLDFFGTFLGNSNDKKDEE